MAGSYCKFCDRRCFVLRVLPPNPRAPWTSGQSLHLATCLSGAEFDRRQTGYDHTTAINPVDPPTTVDRENDDGSDDIPDRHLQNMGRWDANHAEERYHG